MQSQILHVWGNNIEEIYVPIARAIINMLEWRSVYPDVPAPPLNVVDGFRYHYIGPIRIACIDSISIHDIDIIIRSMRPAKTKRIQFVRYNDECELFIDTRFPHITPAGWFPGTIRFPSNFPRLKFKKYNTPILPVPIIRAASLIAEFYMDRVFVFELPSPIVITPCEHEKHGFKFVLLARPDAPMGDIVGRQYEELCADCLTDREKRSPFYREFVLAILPAPRDTALKASLSLDTEFALLGEGTAGDYIACADPRSIAVSLVDKTLILLNYN